MSTAAVDLRQIGRNRKSDRASKFGREFKVSPRENNQKSQIVEASRPSEFKREARFESEGRQGIHQKGVEVDLLESSRREIEKKTSDMLNQLLVDTKRQNIKHVLISRPDVCPHCQFV